MHLATIPMLLPNLYIYRVLLLTSTMPLDSILWRAVSSRGNKRKENRKKKRKVMRGLSVMLLLLFAFSCPLYLSLALLRHDSAGVLLLDFHSIYLGRPLWQTEFKQLEGLVIGSVPCSISRGSVYYERSMLAMLSTKNTRRES